MDGARDYRMMSRQMVDAVIRDSEYNRFSKGIFSWVGFHTYWISYENVERSAGETKWSFWKLFKYSVEGILAYTTVPLYLSSIMGFHHVRLFFPGIGLYCNQSAGLWGSGGRVALFGVHYYLFGRIDFAVHGGYGPVCG